MFEPTFPKAIPEQKETTNYKLCCDKYSVPNQANSIEMDTEDNSIRKGGGGSSKRRPPKKVKPIFSDESSSNDLLIVDEAPSPAKLNIKKDPTTSKMPLTPGSTGSNNKKRKKRDSASSDEERWLTAIESGKLEDVDDELKKIKPKDPSLMTARQRAMYDRSTTEGTTHTTTPTLMSLPTGYKEKVMTAEALQKAAIKSQKRKQLADEKREKDKKKTMERLLKKQDSKASKNARGAKLTKTAVPMIQYKQTQSLCTISLPEGVDYPLKSEKAPVPKPRIMCNMGCGNVKKYNCSKTGVPLCSLECYKRNISSRII